MLKLSGEQALPTKASVLPHTDFLPWEVIPQKILETHYRDPYSSQQQQESGQETAREAASFQQGSAEWDGDASSFGDHEPETTRFEGLPSLKFKSSKGRAQSGGSVRPGFGSGLPRLEVFPRLGALDRASGTTAYGNGMVMGRVNDPLWGAAPCSPDYLNKSGAYQAPAPGEKLNRGKMYWDMQNPMLAKLWSKSKAPRIAKMAEPQYAEHVGNSADPYNVTERSDVILKLGNVALDPNRPSAIFVSSVPRKSIMYQSFENYFAEEPTRIASGRPCSSKASPGQGIQRAPDEKGVRVVPARRQSHGSRPSTETRPDTAESDTWGLRSVRFGPVCMDTFIAVAKSKPSDAPPSTKYSPSIPVAPTIAEKARPKPSTRPGIRGGLYRESVSGTGTFTSQSLRTFQERGKSPPRVQLIKGMWAGNQAASETYRSSRNNSGSKGTSGHSSPRHRSPSRTHPAAIPSPKQVADVLASQNKLLAKNIPRNPIESVDRLLDSWSQRSIRAAAFTSRMRGEPMLTEETLDRWRSLMW